MDLLNAFNHSDNLEFFERSSNASYIALIPKMIGAKELKDYKPINLIGSFYRILSKALAGRLKKVLPV